MDTISQDEWFAISSSPDTLGWRKIAITLVRAYHLINNLRTAYDIYCAARSSA